MRRRPWNESEYESMWMSRECGSEVRTPLPERSMASLSLAIEDKSSVEPFADAVSGVDAFELFLLLESSDSPFSAALAAYGQA